MIYFNLLRNNLTKRSNTLKQFVGKYAEVGLKRLIIIIFRRTYFVDAELLTTVNDIFIWRLTMIYLLCGKVEKYAVLTNKYFCHTDLQALFIGECIVSFEKPVARR